MNIEHIIEDDGTHRVIISDPDATTEDDSKIGSLERLVFTFTEDGVESSFIVATSSKTYTETVDELGCP